MKTPKAPRFVHDGHACVYLGRFDRHTRGRFERYDLYWCVHPSHPNLSSLLARYGNEPSEYRSSLPPEAFAEGYEPNEIERETLARALERKLYCPWIRSKRVENAVWLARADLHDGDAEGALAWLERLEERR